MNLYEALIAGMDNEQQYVARDPWARAALGISQISDPEPTRTRSVSKSEAFGIPFVRNLLSGVLLGEAKDNAKASAYEDTAESPLLALLKEDGYGANVGPVASGDDYGAALADPKTNSMLSALMGKYSGEMPDQWSDNQGRADMTLLALLKEEEDRKEVIRDTAEAATFRDLLKQGRMIDPESGVIVEAPGVKAIETAKAKRQKTAEIEAESDARGYNPIIEDDTDKLRKEFSALPEVKEFSLVKSSADALSKALKDKSAVSDQELVRRVIQMIEPGLAVREGEQKAVAMSQSIPDEWRGSLQKALSGGSALDDTVREGIKRVGERAYNAKAAQFEKAREFFELQAKLKKLDPERVSYLGKAAPVSEIFGGAGAGIPAGMKLLRNKKTGETKLVPING